MSDDIPTRKVAKRNEVNQKLIDAAHVMPGTSAPKTDEQTVTVREALIEPTTTPKPRGRQP